MKRNLLMLTLGFSALISQAQKNKTEEFFIFKADWQPASKTEDAAYFARLMQISDTCWQWDIYNYTGPLIVSQRSKDKNQKQKHGWQLHYKPSGYLDSSGQAIDGALSGDWFYFNDSGKAAIKKVYDHGVLISVTDLTKETDTAKEKKSSSDEHESEFPGGVNKWGQYLSKNLRYPDRAMNASVMGEVIVQFIVDSTGLIDHVELYKSVEFSLDEETMRLIKNSPKWKPASQNGKYVKSYKRQPLRFKL